MNDAAFPSFINPTPLGQDFMRYDFLTPEFCEYIVMAAEGQEWSSNRFDAYRTQDIYLEEAIPDLFQSIDLHLQHRIWPSVTCGFSTSSSFTVPFIFSKLFSIIKLFSLSISLYG